MNRLDWLIKNNKVKPKPLIKNPTDELIISAIDQLVANPINLKRVSSSDYEYAIDSMIHLLPHISSDKAKDIMKLLSVYYFGHKFLDKSTETNEGIINAYKQFKSEHIERASKNSEILNQMLILKKGDYGQIKKLIETSLLSESTETIVEACKRIIDIENLVEDFNQNYEA